MSEIHQGNAGSILAAALVGAAVGAGVALLFAPCSGKESRRWLADKSRQVKDKTTSALDRGKDVTRRAAREIGTVVEAAGKSVDRPAPIAAGTATLHG